ncbi:uncharacterized protein [Apostichopus japonicus]|uniref:uncharacterized protein n=1 Tax=Stichopus japonicus TaxID=307972 RepID=UPI003AB8A9C5
MDEESGYAELGPPAKLKQSKRDGKRAELGPPGKFKQSKRDGRRREQSNQYSPSLKSSKVENSKRSKEREHLERTPQASSTPKSNGSTPKSNGLTPKSNGLTPKSNGLTPKSNGLTPKSNGLTPKSNGLTPNRNGESRNLPGIPDNHAHVTEVQRNGERNSIKTEAVSDSYALPVIQDERPRRTNGSVKDSPNRGNRERTEISDNVTYATVPSRSERKSRKSQESKADNYAVSDVSATYATVKKKGERRSQKSADAPPDTEIDGAKVQDGDRGLINDQSRGEVTYATVTKNKERRSTKPQKTTTGEYPLPVVEHQRTTRNGSAKTTGEIQSRRNSSRDKTASAKQHRRVSRSVSLQDNRHTAAANVASLHTAVRKDRFGTNEISFYERRKFSFSRDKRHASITSSGSLRSSISGSSDVRDNNNDDSLPSDSLYALIPEEPDKPLPIISSLESPSEIDEIVFNLDTAPSVSTDDVDSGHVNTAFQPEINISSGDVILSNFEDDGYKEAMKKRARDESRKRRVKSLVIASLLLFFVLLVVIGAVLILLYFYDSSTKYDDISSK